MTTNRLEAFSDGVIAIIITIMVFQLKVPTGASFSDLKPVLPTFLTYIGSFTYLGIYWNNHHHLLHITQKVNGKILWANSHLLFWLSLFPFTTSWMGETNFDNNPVGLYGFVLLMSAIAWKTLAYFIIQNEGEDSKIRLAYKKDWKGNISVGSYLLALILSFSFPIMSIVLYIFVALIWIIPDPRIERHIK